MLGSPDSSEPVQVEEINADDFEKLGSLKRGQSGSMYRCKRKGTNEEYALKVLNPMAGTQRGYFDREVRALSLNASPSIVKLHGMKRPDQQGCGALLLMEYVSGGDLEDALKEDKLNGTEKAIIAAGIAFGMHSLHQKSFIHRDLKPANVLLDENKHAKICDLGLARTEGLQTTGPTGTPLYMAPEVMEEDGYDHMVDVFSFAMILYQMVTDMLPSQGKRISPMRWIALIQNGTRPTFPTNANRNGMKLVESCWDHSPYNRPEFGKILTMMGNLKGHFIDDVDEAKFMNYYNEMVKITKFDRKAYAGAIIEDNNEKEDDEEAEEEVKNINITDYEKVKELGKGAYGKVHLVKSKVDGKEYALKELVKLTKENDMLTLFQREVETLSRNKHGCIVRLVGVHQPDDDGCGALLLMEYIEGGNLKEKLKEKTLTGTEKAIIALGIAFGMCYLHSGSFIHRDLKPENVMLDSKLYPKICDLGLARVENIDMTHERGTPAYMAPEIVDDKYDHRIDIYSYGAIMYELVTGLPVHTGKVRYFQWINAIKSGWRPEIPDGTNPDAKMLIEKCWSQNPSERPEFREIIEAMKDSKGQFLNEKVDQVEFMKYYDMWADKLVRNRNRESLEKMIKVNEADYTYMKTIDHDDYGIMHVMKFSGEEGGPLAPGQRVVMKRESPYLHQEFTALTRNVHPCVVRVFGGKDTGDFDNGLMILDYAENNLKQAFSRTPQLSRTSFAIIAAGIAFAMRTVHKNNFVHRNLKPSNILLDEDNYPMITGFSRACERSSKMTSAVGTLEYIAPEVVANEPYDQKADVYSFGMIFYQILTGVHPRTGFSRIKWHTHIMNGGRPEIPEDVPAAGRDILEACWTKDTMARASFNDIIDKMRSSQGMFLESVEKNAFMSYFKKMDVI